MLIVKPSVTIEWITPDAEAVIERAGRTCYKSEDKITPESAGRFIEKLIGLGHHSVLEHASACLRFVCDRGVSHELVRHRLASFSQESTRYVRYDEPSLVGIIEPPGLTREQRATWAYAVDTACNVYRDLLSAGQTPQIARAVLPTCLKTEIVVTANFREWRHIFTLRCARAAHPQMRSLMIDACELLYGQAPNVFADVRAAAQSEREGV